eukprot:2100201-Pyramimonas_sp.AAC.1
MRDAGVDDEEVDYSPTSAPLAGRLLGGEGDAPNVCAPVAALESVGRVVEARLEHPGDVVGADQLPAGVEER